MNGLTMTAQLLLSLSILIVVHEGGHFLAARMFKIRVEKFYLFFDFLFPLANVLNFSIIKFKKGDTEYGMGWFPLGGYVKIAGMVDESMDTDQMKSEPQPWEFRTKPAWQRMIVMLGGIIVNIITGIIIFTGLTWALGDVTIPMKFVNDHGGVHALELAEEIGLKTGDQIINVTGRPLESFNDVIKPSTLLDKDGYFTVVRNGQEVKVSIPSDFIEKFSSRDAAEKFLRPRMPAVIESVAPGSVASRTDLQPGDQFTGIDGKPVYYFDEIMDALKRSSSDSIQFSVQRGAQVLSFREKYTEDRKIGFYPRGLDKSNLDVKNYSFGESLVLGPVRAFDVIWVQIKAFKKMFSGEIDARKSLSGPIGMAQMYGTTWDWERFWRMTGLLSMVLAFMNFLPIPALDGGYVMFLLYEMITGKEPSEKFFENALRIGFAILIALMIFVFYNDIARWISN
jgi:regulator of sigma E protease